MPKEPAQHSFQFEDEVERISNGQGNHPIEFEVVTDVHLLGEFGLDHFYFAVWDWTEEEEKGPRSLTFRTATLYWDESFEIPQGSPEGYYSGGGTVHEFASLFSLALRRRFRVGPVVRSGDQPRRENYTLPVHQDLLTSAGSIYRVRPVLLKAKGLIPKDKLRFMLATRLYAQALLQMEENTDLAFISLVASIEALSAEWKLGQEEPSLEDEIENLIQQIGDHELAQQLRNKLWKKHSSARKFIHFILSHIDDSFWSDPSRPSEEWKRVRQDDIEDLIKKIYKARSDFLHSGLPLHPAVTRTMRGCEIDPGGNRSIGRKMWKEKDKLPSITFIERLAQHVLMQFLIRNQA